MDIKKVKAEMKNLGVLHAKNGKRLTPYDCQEIDKKIFAIANTLCDAYDHTERVRQQTKIYTQLRGAFNKGWQEEYYKTVS